MTTQSANFAVSYPQVAKPVPAPARLRRWRAWLIGLLLCCAAARPASAQNSSFQINRYEPTAAGEWSFWVDHPFYSRTHSISAGLTLDYGRSPLILGYITPSGSFAPSLQTISQQLVAHVDLAGTFHNRVQVTLSLPVTLMERGEMGGGVGPVQGVTTGDPRAGFLVRLYGQPYSSRFSVSIGGQLWLPLLNAFDRAAATENDQSFRALPKLVLGGVTSRLLWSASAGVLLRPEATIGSVAPTAGRTAGSELQLGVGLSYADRERRLAFGPELVFATSLSGNALVSSYSSLEALLGLHYNIASTVQVSAGGGIGILRQPGTPDSRFLLRVAYAPMKKNSEVAADRDRDGVPDARDFCPDVHQGSRQDPQRPGCPLGDQDRDGVFDGDDRCPEVSQGLHPDPQQPGCPLRGHELEAQDRRPDKPEGEPPPSAPPSSAAGDLDRDGVSDLEDVCPKEPQGVRPDPARRGCPFVDRDNDSIADAADACPDQRGGPSTDPKQNGCPGLVEVKAGALVVLEPVHFANDEDIILEKSLPVVRSVAEALKASPTIKKVRIEGHTDNRGQEEHNQELSERRARSVKQWLVEHGIEADRLETQGYGSKRPIADNGHHKGRAKNRRIDFSILDSQPAQGAQASAPIKANPPPDAPSLLQRDPLAPIDKREAADKAHRHPHHRHRAAKLASLGTGEPS